MPDRTPADMGTIDPFARRNPGVHARIGIGRSDATPIEDVPINNWGASTSTRATGVSAGLTATVLVIGELDAPPASRLALVLLDLGWWRTATSEAAVRDAVAEELALPVEQVLTALSHTHAGPAIDPEAVADGDSDGVTAYLRTLDRAVREAAHRARDDASPGLLEWGRGTCHLARVRDQWVAEGDGRYLCGFAPDAPADSTLLVGRLTTVGPDPAGEPSLRAVVVNYACHPTTLGPRNGRISADFVGPARDLVEAELGVPMIFIQGASGELAPRRQYQGETSAGDDATRANGRELGYAVLSTIAGMLPPGQELRPAPTVESGAPLGMWTLAPAPQADRRVAHARSTVSVPRNHLVEEWANRVQTTPAATAERGRRASLITRLTVGDHLPLTVTVYRLGDAVLVAQPGEAYSMLQRDLRSRFSDRPVVVANLAGGPHHGYLPPRQTYGQNIYQVWQTPAGAGALETVHDVAVQLVEQLIADPTGAEGAPW